MNRPLPPFWQLRDFGRHLERWAAEDDPTEDQRLTVALWIFDRGDDPWPPEAFQQRDLPGLWVARVPGTRHGDRAVLCAFWVFEDERVVRCDQVATLALPF